MTVYNTAAYLDRSITSIINQTYKNIRHIVSVDDVMSYQYVKKNGVLDRDIIFMNKPIRINSNHMPYNLYMNYLMNEVKSGWILFLDDDDILIDNDSINIIIENLPKSPALLIFKSKVGDKYIPDLNFKKKLLKEI